MFRLSIIIPVPGGVDFSAAETSAVEETLVSVLENRPAHSEIILVCDSACSDPYNLGDEVEFVTVDHDASANVFWPTLANAAIQRARGRFVHVIQPGIVVEAGWERDACDYLSRASDTVMGVSPRIESATGKGTIGVELSTCGSRQLISAGETIQDERVFGPCQQANFFRRVNLIEIGGWNEAVHPQVADVELALRLHSHAMRIVHRDASVLHSPGLEQSIQPTNGLEIVRDLERIRRHYATAGVIANRGWLAAMSATFRGSVLGRLAGRFGEMPTTCLAIKKAEAPAATPLSRAA